MPAQIRRGNAGCDDAPPSRPIPWLGLIIAGVLLVEFGSRAATADEP